MGRALSANKLQVQVHRHLRTSSAGGKHGFVNCCVITSPVVASFDLRCGMSLVSDCVCMRLVRQSFSVHLGLQTHLDHDIGVLTAPPACLQLFFQPLSQSLRMVMHLGEPLPADRPTFYFDFAVLVLFFMVRISRASIQDPDIDCLLYSRRGGVCRLQMVCADTMPEEPQHPPCIASQAQSSTRLTTLSGASCCGRYLKLGYCDQMRPPI